MTIKRIIRCDAYHIITCISATVAHTWHCDTVRSTMDRSVRVLYVQQHSIHVYKHIFIRQMAATTNKSENKTNMKGIQITCINAL